MSSSVKSGLNPAPTGPESRVIRVFLSSTFRDFMEERDLLVKEVFPELRRKARERGVDVVDVDLRWGITEEESRQGKVIPICLGEIDRCRPYFVGMLGERYGWIPPADQYSPELIERQPWLKEHQGGISVTELEILHGVLNDPAMAGRAFFYLRDPAWSQKQKQPGYVCENNEEEQKLSGLKQRIRTSNFPVQENLPDPKALADRIGADLWELIGHQYPDLDCADALEREERQHASYRRSRLSVYLGGQTYIKKLERWIDVDQQSILITGESGAGKSALIANWMEAHQRTHPDDHLYSHHLGCSNDASSIRPLLARLIETAKQQLPEVYGYSLDVPQDWWELVAKAAEALQSLGRWAQQNNHRWIWVIDGLDRLDPDDQNALPWLPFTIPEGVVLVISALDCPGREILLEREFKVLTIGPLKAKEQDALIKQYLGRYTKQLIAELRSTILSHPLAGLPLFLRVLLEELRQCGRYETLGDQLAGYLRAETIDELYERVLGRLEADGNSENVRMVMTALWASRAGLSEDELLSITGLKPLQWASIDIALEEALGRNGNRLLFDHDYLRRAVEDRYLPTEEKRRNAHSVLADWFGSKPQWDERKGREWPWQLLKADRKDDFVSLACNTNSLCEMSMHLTSIQIADLLRASGIQPKHLEPPLTKELEREDFEAKVDGEDLSSMMSIAIDALERFGLSKNLVLNLRYSCTASKIKVAWKDRLFNTPEVQRLQARINTNEEGNVSSISFTDAWIEGLQSTPREETDFFATDNSELFQSLCNLAKALGEIGMYGKAKHLYEVLIEISEHSETVLAVHKGNMLIEYAKLELNRYDQDYLGQYGATEPYLQNALRLVEAASKSVGEGKAEGNIASFRLLQTLIDIKKRDMTETGEVLALSNNLLSQKKFYLGSNHHETLESDWQSALLSAEIVRNNDFDADDFDFESRRPEWVKPIKEFPWRYSNMYGKNHPVSISRLSEYASYCRIACLYKDSQNLHQSAYKLASESLNSNELVFSQVRIQYSLLLMTLANRRCSASTSARYRLEALRLLEDEWQIQTKASNDSSDLSILQSQINLVELCVESGLDQKAFRYLNNIVYSATLKLGCDHPIIQHALMAISDLGYLPGFDGEIDFSSFYRMIFNACEWMLDHSFAIPLITLNDIILVSCSMTQGLNKDNSRLTNALVSRATNADQESALLLNDLSTLAWINKDFGQAIAILTKVIETSEIRGYASEAVRLCLLDKLGVFLRDAGEYTRSIGCFERTYDLRRSRHGGYAYDTIYSAVQLALSKQLSGNPKAISGLTDYLGRDDDRPFAESLHPCSRHLIVSLFPNEALEILNSIEIDEELRLYTSIAFESQSVHQITAAVDLASHLSQAFPA